MKPALYVTLGRSWGQRPSAHNLMVVTSVKGNHLYGRDLDGNPTHKIMDRLELTFDTIEVAKKAVSLAAIAFDEYQPAVKNCEANLALVRDNQLKAMREVAMLLSRK